MHPVIDLGSRASQKKSVERQADSPGLSSPWSWRWCWALLFLAIVFFSLIRVRLINMPLERDEGEYAYAGQLILEGVAPYQLAYNMKLPGTYAAYAVILAAFGQSVAGIHAALLLMNAATAILVFLLGVRLLGRVAGLAAGTCYLALSTSEGVLGFAAHATHFVVLAALGGILLLLRAVGARRLQLYFWSGFLFGLAFLFKQPGIMFAVFGLIFVIVSGWQEKEDVRAIFPAVAIYLVGAAVPFVTTCAVLFFTGTLQKMWFWTFSYASQYASIVSVRDGWENLTIMGAAVVEPCFLIWIGAGLGLAALAWDSRTWKHAFFLLSFLIFSWLAVCPEFYFRPHYFVLVLPAVCLFVGVAVHSAEEEIGRRFPGKHLAGALPLLLVLLAITASVFKQREVLFELDPIAASHHAYGDSPFPEAEVISKYLRENSGPASRIAVLGSDPEIYFYSHRRSATGYIYMYPLMENQTYALEMQHEMAREVEANRPEYVVIEHVKTAWMATAESNRFVFDWMQKFVGGQYEVAGVADEISPETRYVWGEAARSYRVVSDASVVVLKRIGR